MLLSAFLMSIGWALRGSIGGGPLGAMIPGALWAIGIAYQRKWTAGQASFFVGLSALAIGLGGQMTYGQTIGLLREPDTRLWGLLGLTLKGAIWGLLGGAVMSLALLMPKRPLTISLVLMVATQLGWQFVNQPKLIYFSNRVIKPREEIWAGLGLSALALILLLRRPVIYRLAGYGALGGAIGFGAGSLFNLVPVAGFPGWKMMEFSFGFVLGTLLHFAVPPEAPEEAGAPKAWHVWCYPLLAVFTVGVDLYLSVRFAFTAVVAMLLLVLPRHPQLGWGLGVSVTLAAACAELYQSHRVWAVALAIGPAALLGWWQLHRSVFHREALALLLGCCCWIYALEYFPFLR